MSLQRRTFIALLTLTATGVQAKPHAPPPATSMPADAAARVDQLNGAGGSAPIAAGARSTDVVRAQALLDHAWFSPGEIDGRASANLQRAVSAFQKANGLKPSGRVDAETWTALKRDAPPVFAKYTITDADAAGPFEHIPTDMSERAQRKAMSYESIDEALGERFHMSPALLKQLNPKTKLEAGRDIVVVDVSAAATQPANARSIRIDKGARVLSVLGNGDSVLAAFPISIGGPDDPLPLGAMKITKEVKDPSFTYDPTLIKRSKPGAVKVEIPPGPNNPVGTMWLGLTKPHWGIHGTPSPEKLGREETNGCIHLTNWDAQRLSMLVKVGFVVDVRA